ncbi:MAG: RcnB family protein [Pseudomonadota bacterium]|jgi:Ni/Co efflux regulator RcnB|uniref:RcnB family protein n=1 Tax=Sphingomonas ginsenosidimutans TaxID=862134 RepID=UPI001FE5A174|nr:RcnB family protein [Sphingomonas ginsenosidimutans]MEE2916988.1 RcnB family protein [Pseudomonadota bacterium]
MRLLPIAAVASLSLAAGAPAVAQTAPGATTWNGGRHGPSDRGQWTRGQWNGTRAWHGPRWGGQIGGRWWGGMRAPGGWGAYRRPVRGWALPGYWIAPGWHINDWQAYGLRQPPYGYTWSRYYDDAVLIDPRGTVYDSVGGIDWSRGDAGYGGYGADVASDGYPRLPYPTRDADGGLGGAAIGAVVGGVAGNVIAGSGNRLGGTLLGAGAGALAGMAIDKADRAGRVPVAPPPGAGYPPPGAGYPPPPGAGGPGAPPPPVVAYQQGSYGGDYAGTTYSGTTYYGPPPADYPAYAPYPPVQVTGGNGTVVTTTQGAPGYVAGGWYYPPATITTITVQSGGTGQTVQDVYGDRVVHTGRRYTKAPRRYTKSRCRC